MIMLISEMEFIQYRKISVIVIPEETHMIRLYHKIMIMIRENTRILLSNLAIAIAIRI